MRAANAATVTAPLWTDQPGNLQLERVDSRELLPLGRQDSATQGGTTRHCIPSRAVSAHPQPGELWLIVYRAPERPDFDEHIRELAEKWWIYRFLGYHTCSQIEKIEIVVLLIFIIFIVGAMLSAALIEAEAFSVELGHGFDGTLQSTAMVRAQPSHSR